jgi:Pyridine nucleotide-disulphide oxidoreductase
LLAGYRPRQRARRNILLAISAPGASNRAAEQRFALERGPRGEFMNFDAIIIGSGQGGNPLAHRLADGGWRVALIEERFLGGTCVNTGCTPTKTMVHRAQVAHYARNAARWGVNASEVSVDYRKSSRKKTKWF